MLVTVLIVINKYNYIVSNSILIVIIYMSFNFTLLFRKFDFQKYYTIYHSTSKYNGACAHNKCQFLFKRKTRQFSYSTLITSIRSSIHVFDVANILYILSYFYFFIFLFDFISFFLFLIFNSFHLLFHFISFYLLFKFIWK